MKRLPVFLVLALAAAAVWPAQVRIVQPPPDQPLAGEVEVRVEVLPAGTPVERIEILLDGKPVGTAARPPYHLLIDAGDEGREHRLEAVAHLADGSEVRTALAAPRLQAESMIQVDLQQLFLTVDRGGRPLPDLTRDDFTVYDQETPQPIVTFGRGDVPFTAVLLVDTSASMAGPPLEKALEGARAFFSGLAPLDQGKLILFSDHVRLETPFTSVRSVLTLGLGGVSAEGGTALNDALYLAVKRLEPLRGRKIAVLLSDGVDIESVLSISEASALSRGQVTLYWLRLGKGLDSRRFSMSSAWRDAPEHAHELEQLSATVAESGGRIIELSSVEEIPATFSALLKELRDQYVLGITPRQTGGKGTWHEVRVEAKGGVRARAQSGYFEP
ncbi:MAG TPA: VWA domain-containing protein [Thermoanaerobaculia bacterium]|jgi:Ca-activated chloride channel family protein